MENPFADLAIIIPVGPNEDAWRNLLGDLKDLPVATDIIFAATEPAPQDFANLTVEQGRPLIWMVTKKGRALQLNSAARSTTKSFLWFLHADTRINERAIQSLENSLREHTINVIHYFNLNFLNDGPSLMWINTIGVWIRSHWMGIPFGDQGFCLSKKLFLELGTFNENSLYGEDHLLIWAAHQHGISLHCTGVGLSTSARKYQIAGWGSTTASHMFFTAKQAVPELAKLIKRRVFHVE